MAWKYVAYKPADKYVVKKYSGERYAGKKHHRNGITAMSGLKKDMYIAKRFRTKKGGDIIPRPVKGDRRERTQNPTEKL